VSVAVTDRTGRPGPLWVVPALAFFALFALLPLVLVVYLSLTSWDAVGDPEFIGLGNWSRAFGDGELAHSLKLSAVLTVMGWAMQTPIALGLGVWTAGLQRSRAAAAAIFFVPWILSGAAVALIFQTLMNPNFGLPVLGDLDLLGHPSRALLAVALVTTWQFVPLHTLIYQSGARQIPKVLYDAATIDGATRFQQLYKITIPQLRNTIVTSSVLMIVGAMTYFETVLILTHGGPGDATAVLPFRMYSQGFEAFEMGYASAIAVGLVLIGTALSLLIVRVSGYGKMRSTLEGL
jgi:xylobiose transport system permease protein